MSEQREGIERAEVDSPSLVDGSSAPATEQGEGTTYVERVEALLVRADNALRTAEAWGDVKATSAALREVRATLELLGKATGELDANRPRTDVTLILAQLQASGREALAANPNFGAIEVQTRTHDGPTAMDGPADQHEHPDRETHGLPDSPPEGTPDAHD